MAAANNRGAQGARSNGNGKANYAPQDKEYEGNKCRGATLAFFRDSERVEGAFAGKALASFEEHGIKLARGYPIGLVMDDEDEGETFALFIGQTKVGTLTRATAKTGTVMLKGTTTVAVKDEDNDVVVPEGIRMVAFKARRGTALAKSGGRFTLTAEWAHDNPLEGEFSEMKLAF